MFSGVELTVNNKLNEDMAYHPDNVKKKRKLSGSGDLFENVQEITYENKISDEFYSDDELICKKKRKLDTNVRKLNFKNRKSDEILKKRSKIRGKKHLKIIKKVSDALRKIKISNDLAKSKLNNAETEEKHEIESFNDKAINIHQLKNFDDNGNETEMVEKKFNEQMEVDEEDKLKSTHTDDHTKKEVEKESDSESEEEEVENEEVEPEGENEIEEDDEEEEESENEVEEGSEEENEEEDEEECENEVEEGSEEENEEEEEECENEVEEDDDGEEESENEGGGDEVEGEEEEIEDEDECGDGEEEEECENEEVEEEGDGEECENEEVEGGEEEYENEEEGENEDDEEESENEEVEGGEEEYENEEEGDDDNEEECENEEEEDGEEECENEVEMDGEEEECENEEEEECENEEEEERENEEEEECENEEDGDEEECENEEEDGEEDCENEEVEQDGEEEECENEEEDGEQESENEEVEMNSDEDEEVQVYGEEEECENEVEGDDEEVGEEEYENGENGNEEEQSENEEVGEEEDDEDEWEDEDEEEVEVEVDGDEDVDSDNEDEIEPESEEELEAASDDEAMNVDDENTENESEEVEEDVNNENESEDEINEKTDNDSDKTSELSENEYEVEMKNLEEEIANIGKRVKSEQQMEFEDESITLQNNQLAETVKNESTGEPDTSLQIQDPYILHFSKCMSKKKASEIDDGSKWGHINSVWPMLGQVVNSLPKVEPVVRNKFKLLLEEEEDTDLPPIGVTLNPPLYPTKSLDSCFLHKHLTNQINSFSSFQSEILTITSQYIDLYYPNADPVKWDKIQMVYAFHCVNHILKARQLTTDNSAKLEDLGKKKEETENSFNDQGFTRAKVLMLLPFKNTAYNVIKKIVGFLNLEVKNKKRFELDFGPPDKADDKKKLEKPEDFDQIFAGDINEDFKIGLKLTQKSLKLYSEFFESDIIIASPLGLRFHLEKEENPEARAFLSSIEVLIMDQADIFLMQNWEHVLVIRDELNKVPKNFHKIIPDFNRVRRWCVDGLASYYRQTIIFSSTLTDYNQAFFLKTRNLAGKMQVMNPPRSVLADVKVNSELVFLRVQTDASVTHSNPDAQFDHFINHVLPLLRRKDLSHTLIYVPDYCDYIRLVSFFKEDGGTSVATINEYMVKENDKVAKARSLFFEGKKRFLIYTERFHFYRRYKIKGIQHVVFYELPTYPHFFSEICNFMENRYQNRREPPLFEPNNILVPFQKFDENKLLNVFGVELTSQILNSDKLVHKCDIGS